MWLAGIDWAAKILPVRVLGKCGGYDSDIMDGVAWAAGLSVPGVPANPYPASIINLSVGGTGVCEAGYHAVFTQALDPAKGSARAIIVAAGNETSDVSSSVPANCGETIAVAATLSTGYIASYSNFGAGIALSAPGGSSGDLQDDSIAILYNHGKTVPDVDAWAIGAGTSFSAPIVSAVASLVLGLAPNLTAAQLRALLTSTASAFPAGSDCDTSRCGAGIVNAHAAVVAAQGGVSPANYQGMWWAGPVGGWLGNQLRAAGQRHLRDLVHLRHHRQGLVDDAHHQWQSRARRVHRQSLHDDRPAVLHGPLRQDHATAAADRHGNAQLQRCQQRVVSLRREPADGHRLADQGDHAPAARLGALRDLHRAAGSHSRRRPTTRTSGGRAPARARGPSKGGASISRTRATSSSRAGSPTTSTARRCGSSPRQPRSRPASIRETSTARPARASMPTTRRSSFPIRPSAR